MLNFDVEANPRKYFDSKVYTNPNIAISFQTERGVSPRVILRLLCRKAIEKNIRTICIAQHEKAFHSWVSSYADSKRFSDRIMLDIAKPDDVPDAESLDGYRFVYIHIAENAEDIHAIGSRLVRIMQRTLDNKNKEVVAVADLGIFSEDDQAFVAEFSRVCRAYATGLWTVVPVDDRTPAEQKIFTNAATRVVGMDYENGGFRTE